jgi:ABC-type multidrug transport system fused ATPase/permease subunit
MDYDRILVLGRGKVLELGSPQELMANPRSHLAKMVADANQAHQGK